MRFNPDIAIFQQIADQLTDEILEGRLHPGDRLPSARELAVTLEVNPNTAARALQVLADDGVARPERGTGYFVDEQALKRARASRRETFIQTQIPHLARTLNQLGISRQELLEILQREEESK